MDNRRKISIIFTLSNILHLINIIFINPWVGLIGWIISTTLFIRKYYDTTIYQPFMIDITEFLIKGKPELIDEIFKIKRNKYEIDKCGKNYFSFFVVISPEATICSSKNPLDEPLSILITYNKRGTEKEDSKNYFPSSVSRPREIYLLPKKTISHRKILEGEDILFDSGEKAGDVFYTRRWESKINGIRYTICFCRLELKNDFLEGSLKIIQNFNSYIDKDEFDQRFNSIRNRHNRSK